MGKAVPDVVRLVASPRSLVGPPDFSRPGFSVPKQFKNEEDVRIKHLEMTQAVIARLAGNSFLIKGWAITLAAAFCGFALNSREGILAVAGAVTTLFFWILDAEYLRSERLFRAFYNRVREGDADIPALSLDATAPAFVRRVQAGSAGCAASIASRWGTLRRPTLMYFYGMILLVAIVVAVVAWSLPAPK